MAVEAEVAENARVALGHNKRRPSLLGGEARVAAEANVAEEARVAKEARALEKALVKTAEELQRLTPEQEAVAWGAV